MINFGIYVCVESVLIRRHLVPKSLRLFAHEVDSRQGFRSLEPILPGNNQPNGRPVLVEQRLAVDARRQESQLIGRFGQGQTLCVWPGKVL